MAIPSDHSIQDTLITKLNKVFYKFYKDWLNHNLLGWWLDIVEQCQNNDLRIVPIKEFYHVEGDGEIFTRTSEVLTNLQSLELLYGENRDVQSASKIRDAIIQVIGASSRNDLFIKTDNGFFKRLDEHTIGYYQTTCPLVNYALELSLSGKNPHEVRSLPDQ